MAETNTSNIGFEKQIWDAACVLRGNLDASEYKSVVLGLIFLKYICQRPANKARGLLWEFVGGKVETGETREQALVRECQEELAITLDVGEVFMDVVHEYPDLTVHLTLFNSSIRAGIPQKLEHNDIRWITVDEIDQYDFCPADEEILTRLKTIK